MVSRSLRSAVVACSLVLAVGNAPAKELPLLASVEAVIEDRYGLQYVAIADLGYLLPDREGIIEITLKNSTKQLIEIDEIESGCACLSPKIKDARLEPGSSTVFSFVLRTSAKGKRPDVGIMSKLRLKNKASINLSIRYRIEGLLVFPDPIAAIRIDPAFKTNTFSVPLVMTPPLHPKLVTIEASEELEHASFQIEEKDGAFLLAGTIHESDSISATGYSGRVTLRCEEPAVSTSIELIVKTNHPVSASPSVLRFRPDAEARWYSSKMMVRVLGRDPKEHGKAVIDCLVDGRSPTAVPRHIGNDIYSVTLKISKSLADSIAKESEQAKKVKITAITERGSWTVENIVMIED